MSISMERAWDLFTTERFDSEKISIPAFQGDSRGYEKTTKTVSYESELKLLPLTQSLTNSDDLDRKMDSLKNLSILEKISLLLYWTVYPNRFEPSNVYPIHSIVPSVRTLEPYDIYLTARNKNTCSIYKYVRNHHAIEYVSTKKVMSNDAASVCIHVVARPSILVDKYGEYSYVPITLGLGGLYTQLSQLLSILGIESLINASNPITDQSLELLDECDVELFSLGIDSAIHERDISKLVKKTARLNRRVMTKSVETVFPRLCELKGLFSRGLPSELQKNLRRIRPLLGSTIARRYFYNLQKRTSGNDAVGLIGRGSPLGNAKGAIMLEWLEDVQSFRDTYPGEEFLSVELFSFIETGSRVQRFNRDRGVLEEIPLECSQLNEMLVNKSIKFNLQSMTGCGLIIVEENALSELGVHAMSKLHISAGALGYELCQVASCLGFFSRPLRMMDEAVIENKFRTSGKVIYQIIFGESRRTNFAMEMR